MRFIAIALVVIYHIAGSLSLKSNHKFEPPIEQDWLMQFAQYGHYGVELFFIISGFVLALPFASHYLKQTRRVELKHYFLRRITRLEPPYIISILVLFLLTLLSKSYTIAELLPRLAAGLCYLHNIIFGGFNIINVVTWSLEIEIQFYLLVPLLARIFAIKNIYWRRSVIVLISLAIMLFQYCYIPGGMSPDNRLSLTIFNFLQFFLMGFLLADIYLNEWHENPSHQWQWDIVAIIGWPALLLLWRFQSLSHLLFPWVALLLYCSVFRSVMINRFFTNNWVTITGGMCYSIYLLHNKVIAFAGQLFHRFIFTDNFSINLIIQSLFIIPWIALVSIVFFLLIEKPCMQRDWPQRLLQKTRRLLLQTS